MNTLFRACAVLAIWSLAVSGVSADEVQQHVYPKHGQSRKKQHRDEAHCSDWAQEKTGFDPSAPAPAQVSAKPVTGSGARAVGAGGGAIIGGIAGSAGAGALIGAATGGIIKRVRNNNAASQENAANAEAFQAKQDAYFHARATCLRGRGYRVG